MTYSFPDLEPVCCSTSSSNCCFLTCTQTPQEAGQVVWCSRLLQNCPQFIVIHCLPGALQYQQPDISITDWKPGRPGAVSEDAEWTRGEDFHVLMSVSQGNSSRARGVSRGDLQTVLTPEVSEAESRKELIQSSCCGSSRRCEGRGDTGPGGAAPRAVLRGGYAPPGGCREGPLTGGPGTTSFSHPVSRGRGAPCL